MTEIIAIFGGAFGGFLIGWDLGFRRGKRKGEANGWVEGVKFEIFKRVHDQRNRFQRKEA